MQRGGSSATPDVARTVLQAAAILAGDASWYHLLAWPGTTVTLLASLAQWRRSSEWCDASGDPVELFPHVIVAVLL